MKEKRLNEIKGVVLIAFGLLAAASLVSFTPYDLSFYTSHPNIPPKNFIRTFGAYAAGALFFLFGWSSFLIPVFILWLGIRLFKSQGLDLRLPRIIGAVVLLLSLSSLIGMTSLSREAAAFSRGGFFGFIIAGTVSTYFGRLGAYIIFVTLSLLSFALVTEVLISRLLAGVAQVFGGVLQKMWRPQDKKDQRAQRELRDPRVQKEQKERPSLRARLFGKQEPKEPKPGREDSTGKEGPLKPKIVISALKSIAASRDAKVQTKTKTDEPSSEKETRVKPQPQMDAPAGEYHVPSIDLLESPFPLESRHIKDDLTASARILEETLEDFGISAKVTDIEQGPVITRYELEPAPGVKLNRIVNLGDDIALTMKAQSVRIVAPIPGKGRVGVEVPNSHTSLVYLKEVLASPEFQKAKSKLTLALGKDIAGQPVVADLADMPHLLIAGTTGSGKTVCVNGLILSLLCRATPTEVKLIMVDPKMVELAPFNGIPHLICPVVTDAKKASVALGWLVSEMEERYQLLSKAVARNIESYNEKQQDKETRLPYIVVIIDELADLMTVARDQVEGAISRLAQLSRAVGIHLILATQRPSVDVVTGVIKANFPARISFKVPSKVDSRTVLDMNGADKLLGKGDMLFLKPGEAKLTRAQGALVTDKEIERLVEFIKAQAQPVYDEDILKDQQKSMTANGQKDDLYEEAVKVVMESNQASVSILQRRMRLGYTRAARMIDMMEQEGLVGPFEGSKPRKILIDREAWLKKDLIMQEEEAK